jgi:CheY-like chemotaxis protein/two-component sensor histidine kinase
MSRISRGAFELKRETVEVASIVRNAVETCEPLIHAARHELSVLLPPAPLWVEGDPVRLAQVLSNLLNNATKYTDNGGRITIEAKRDGDSAAISVRDNGAGMTAAVMGRVFEMFTRGDPSVTRAQGGLGIGLALARRLVDMHDGSIEARSDGPGKGSEFTVRLSLVPGPVDRTPNLPDKAASVETGAAPQRILVVDDNADAGDSLSMLLQLLGADVRVARDGPEALEAFRAHDPAVVLLDIGMPGMDGYEVARRIRRGYPDSRASLVALTGWGQESDRVRAREAGFNHHLIKPAEIGALQSLLSSLG